jgi:hypothetical protein
METDIDIEAEEAERQRQQRTFEAMKDAGVSIDEYTQVDYFGFEIVHRVTLPDGKSYIDHQVLNEGARRSYMNQVNREVRLQKGGDAYMKMATGDERHELLKQAIVGWNLMTKNKDGDLVPINFTGANLGKFLEAAPPKVIDVIEKDVREKNPWLLGDITVEDIREQISDLEEMLEQKLKEAEGKES